MFSQRGRITSIVVTGLVSMLVAAGSASAAFISLAGTNWEYETNPGVTFTLTGGAGSTSGNPWLVTETYIYPNLGPIVTHWRQTTDPVEDGDNYFRFSADFVNNSGYDWAGYVWTITDDNMTPLGGGTHPLAAHFHAGPLTQYAPFTTRLPTGGNGNFAMSVGDGVVTNGSVWYASQISVHDYDNYTALNETESVKGGNPGRTAFTVTEQPIPTPEPASIVSFAIACLGVAVLRRRRTTG
jgi:hypothetical protein